MRDRVIILEKESNNEPTRSTQSTVDAGEIFAQGKTDDDRGVALLGDSSDDTGHDRVSEKPAATLAKRASTLGAIRAMLRIEDVRATRLLPAPIEVPGAGGGMPSQPVKVQAKPKSLAALLGKKKES